MIFVTGKGGTGKSTVAAALALQLSQQGKRVQLIELSGYSFYSSVEYCSSTSCAEASNSLKPRALEAVELFQLDPMSSLKQFVKRFALFESAANLLLDSKPARGVLNTLPGLKELAIIGKLTHCLEQNQVPNGNQNGFDVTVVDCLATGHFLALLRAPKALAESIRSGPMGVQCRKMLRQLQDPALCRYLIVTLPEELPLTESLELSASLRDEFSIDAGYLLNKTLAEVSLNEDPTADSTEFGAYLSDWQQRQERVLTKLRQSSDNVVQQLPYCFETDLNRQITVLAQALSEPSISQAVAHD